jgi:AraC family transcriptional regulator of adaptative response/methylated-DNA-[protein]-cysteine methyltransferase
MSTKTRPQIWELPIPTLDGEFLAHYSERGLCELNFPHRSKTRGSHINKAQLPPAVKEWHEQTAKALAAVLAGEEPAHLPPLDLSFGTEFQQQVWTALLGIRCGQTLSYGQVAAAIGKPKALRAVGGACGANPVPVFVPCHRVLAANHAIGGFSSGLDWKRTLLKREGIAAQDRPTRNDRKGTRNTEHGIRNTEH